ncbi:MAG: hypothetical protein D6778_05500 [Nitrospirae bacterium]|nr:MAG: hypothetical protein D6778_05500 [Nitrospirota bacterium]
MEGLPSEIFQTNKVLIFGLVIKVMVKRGRKVVTWGDMKKYLFKKRFPHAEALDIEPAFEH